MVTLKLSLASNKPYIVYSSNGKPYTLNPGSNKLELTYEDYLALAKALGIKPVLKDDNKNIEDVSSEDSNVEKESLPSQDTNNVEESDSTSSEDTDNNEVADDIVEDKESNEIDHVEETDLDNTSTNSDEDSQEFVSDDNESSVIDYNAMTTSQLKEEYKRVTGNVCKIKKKQDIIAFLQGH